MTGRLGIWGLVLMTFKNCRDSSHKISLYHISEDVLVMIMRALDAGV